jgi:ABC-2 type transport system ATP-binding protein
VTATATQPIEAPSEPALDPGLPGGEFVIETRNLTKRFGGVLALDNLNLEIPPAAIGLLGPNGAGKTTLIRLLLGLSRPTSGSASLLGMDTRTESIKIRERVGYMPESDVLPSNATAADFVGHMAEMSGIPKVHARQRAADVLYQVGLDEERYRLIKGFSTGMKQRVKLAQAVVHDPSLVFLDEPTAGMDPHARATTWELVRDLSGRGTTVMLTTHAMDEAETLCDRVAIITGGRLAALGTPGELTRHAAADEVWFAAAPGIDLVALAGAVGLAVEAVTEDRPGEYVLHAPGTPARIADLACFLRDRDITLAALQAGRRSLEEVFLQITKVESA